MFKRFVCVFAIAVAMTFPFASAAETAPSAAGGQKPSVTLFLAAAASLQGVFTDNLLPEFQKLHPDIEVTATYDASGKLQKQIENGLGADVFMSAGMAQMNALSTQGLVEPASVRDVVENKMVLIRGNGSSAPVVDFASAPGTGILALGDPDSVPAGQYAREIFTSLGVWDKAKENASFGTNVTEVLHWVAAGSADLGVVYATDAATVEVEILCEAPEGSMAKKAIYPVGRIAASAHPAEAEALVDFITSDAAADVFRSYGFTPVR